MALCLYKTVLTTGLIFAALGGFDSFFPSAITFHWLSLLSLVIQGQRSNFEIGGGGGHH